MNAMYPFSTFINKNACLNVPSIHRTRASKWSLHWPAGPRRSHRASPDRTSHRLPQTGTAPKWHQSLEYMPGGSRPAQETLRFGVLRPWFSVPCIWGSYDAEGLRRGAGRKLWQACASFQAVPTGWLGSRGHKDALVGALAAWHRAPTEMTLWAAGACEWRPTTWGAVSYTHLTLPTTD